MSINIKDVVCEKIKDLMNSSRKFSVMGIAKYLGYKNRQSYYDLLNREDIGIIELEKIAKYFSKDLSYFVTKQDLKKKQSIDNNNYNDHMQKENLELRKKVKQLQDELNDSNKTIRALLKERTDTNLKPNIGAA